MLKEAVLNNYKYWVRWCSWHNKCHYTDIRIMDLFSCGCWVWHCRNRASHCRNGCKVAGKFWCFDELPLWIISLMAFPFYSLLQIRWKWGGPVATLRPVFRTWLELRMPSPWVGYSQLTGDAGWSNSSCNCHILEGHLISYLTALFSSIVLEERFLCWRSLPVF